MSDLLRDTQRLLGDNERVQYAFFANEGSGGRWIYSRWIDMFWFFGPMLKSVVARPRIVAVTDRSIVLMRGGIVPRTWAHPKGIIDSMPRTSPVEGELRDMGSFITIGNHRLWVRDSLYRYVRALQTGGAPPDPAPS